MIDLNFIRFAIREKRRQMETADLDQLARLNAECNALLNYMDPKQIADTEQNQFWLSKDFNNTRQQPVGEQNV